MSDINLFREIVKSTYTELLNIHPEQFLYMGLGAIDKPLPDPSKSRILIERGLIKTQLERLREIDPNGLPFEHRVDYYAFINYLKFRLFFIEDWPLWRMYPDAPEIAFNMIVSVYLQRNISIKDKFKYIIARVEEIPSYLEKSKSRIDMPIQLFIDAAKLNTTNLKVLIKGIYNHFVSDDRVARSAVEHKAVFDDASEAIDKYMDWLKELRERGVMEYRMGRELYEKLIRLRGLGSNVDKLEKEFKRDMELYRRRLQEKAKEIEPEKDIADIINDICSEYPKSSRVGITLYIQGLNHAKKTIMEKRILRLPDVDVEVVNVPSMIRETLPELYYLPVYRHSGELKTVDLYINISDEERLLRLHNAYYALHRIIQRVYPGFHVLFTYSILNGNIARILFDSPEIYEGWSLYVDTLMGEYGFLNSVKDQFLRLLMIYREALLGYLDIKMNIGEITHTEALNRLVSEGYMDRNEAIPYILRLAISPSLSISQYIGYKYIMGLREDVKHILGDHYSDEWFNNTFLAIGPIPLTYHKSLFLNKVSEYILEASNPI